MHVDATRGLRLNAADHALDAAVAGAGVSLSFKLIASDDVRSGGLVIPFGPELTSTDRAYHFVCLRGHETRPHVRAFRDWIFAEMAQTRQQVGRRRDREDVNRSAPANVKCGLSCLRSDRRKRKRLAMSGHPG